MWEHRGGGQWELFLIEMDSWLHVSIDNRNKPIAQKPSGKRKLSKGSMVVPGNCPLYVVQPPVQVLEIRLTPGLGTARPTMSTLLMTLGRLPMIEDRCLNEHYLRLWVYWVA